MTNYYKEKRRLALLIDDTLKNMGEHTEIDMRHWWYELSKRFELSEKAFIDQCVKAAHHFGLTLDAENLIIYKGG